MAKGIGKGLGGVFLKPPAGMSQNYYSDQYQKLNLTFKIGLWGLAGYPLAGLRRWLQISLGRKQERDIVASRILQGIEEIRASSADERAEIARKWLLLEEDTRVSY